MILARVYRGATVESVHRGVLQIVDGAGREVVSIGDVSTRAFIRSSAKPYQLLPFLLRGGAEKFGFTEAEIALACASHSGEEMHTSLAASMLAKIGLTESDLNCGSHVPFNEAAAAELVRRGEKPTQLHNNCSGKHAAMLGLAKLLNAPTATYELAENPVQKAILEIVGEFHEMNPDEIPVAIDGCCAPNFALPVGAMARAFLKLVRPPATFDDAHRAACQLITDAMMKFPELVGGTERLDTLLMNAAPGKIVSKIGAEGVWLCAVVPSEKWPDGLGIALKIEDGDDRRARPVVAIAILRELGLIAPDALTDYSPMPIRNRRGDQVGHVEAADLKF